MENLEEPVLRFQRSDEQHASLFRHHELDPGVQQLSPGVTTYSFKVCGRNVTSLTSDQVCVRMRSGVFSTPVTIQP